MCEKAATHTTTITDLLKKSTVPCAAAIYYDDMYVVRTFSEEVCAIIPTFRHWVAKEYEHNGSSVDGDRILGKLLGLLVAPAKTVLQS